LATRFYKDIFWHHTYVAETGRRTNLIFPLMIDEPTNHINFIADSNLPFIKLFPSNELFRSDEVDIFSLPIADSS